MSFWIDQLAIRAQARQQRLEQQRSASDQAHLKAARSLPAGFRARVRRMDMAAAKRQDRNLLIGSLLAVALIAGGMFLNGTWAARQRARTRQARIEAMQAAETARAAKANESDLVETSIPWDYPYSPRDAAPAP
jgi:hypothetical protein